MRAFTFGPGGLANPRKWMTCRTSTRCYVVHTDHEAALRRRRGRPIRHVISTLDPSLLTDHDFLGLSHREYILIHFPKTRSHAQASIPMAFWREAEARTSLALMTCENNGSRSTPFPDQSTGFLDGQVSNPVAFWPEGKARRTSLALITYEKIGSKSTPFPGQSTGFLYYYQDRHAAPFEGSVRLRVTSDNAASSFHHGRDLLLPSGCPWQIILPQLACRSNYAGIRDQLLEENLVTEQQLERCRDIFSDSRRVNPESTLFRLTQDFPVDFAGTFHLTVVGKALHPLYCNPFRAGEHGKVYWPWAGSALARFEPSTRPKHAGRRVVHLRITKIVTPVVCTVENYTGFVMKPEEGQLLTRTLHVHAPEPWSYDIDAKNTALAAALRVLWDNSTTP